MSKMFSTVQYKMLIKKIYMENTFMLIYHKRRIQNIDQFSNFGQCLFIFFIREERLKYTVDEHINTVLQYFNAIIESPL